MNINDIKVYGNQMECPHCKQPLNVDLKATGGSNMKPSQPNRMAIITLCCGVELECDAATFIDLLPEKGD